MALRFAMYKHGVVLLYFSFQIAFFFLLSISMPGEPVQFLSVSIPDDDVPYSLTFQERAAFRFHWSNIGIIRKCSMSSLAVYSWWQMILNSFSAFATDFCLCSAAHHGFVVTDNFMMASTAYDLIVFRLLMISLHWKSRWTGHILIFMSWY